MAIETDYIFQNENYPDAYFRIKKLIMGVGDIDDLVEQPDGHLHNVPKKSTENIAFVFVYADKEARDSTVAPINQFGIEFDWMEGENPWQSAYEALKRVEYVATNLKGIKDV